MKILYAKIEIRFSTLVILILLLGGCGGSGGSGETFTTDISGTISYEDKEYGRYGFTGNTDLKAVRFAIVDLVDKYDEVIDSTVTDDNGNYQLSGRGVSLRVRVLAQTDESMGTEIVVGDHDGSVYAASMELSPNTEAGVVDFNITLESSIVGAFNILDVLTNGAQFVGKFARNAFPTLQATWRSKSSQYGTYFCTTNRTNRSCPNGKGIYLLGGSSSGGDTDEFDDDVIYHEFAHYIENVLGIGDSPGGVHYLTENDQDLRLAFSEGWGGFVPGAVKSWLAENNPTLLSTTEGLAHTYFIDTYGSIAGISIDMANPNKLYCPGGRDCFVYSSSEIAVAKILNGINAELGMEGIWNSMSYYMASGTSLPASLETFWDGWLSQRSPGLEELGKLETIFSDRKVYYQHDNFESDNLVGLVRKASVCVVGSCLGEKHYLYHDDLGIDKDLVAFDGAAGETYLVETFDLSNGADTYIRILDSTGSLVYNSDGQAMVNDDRPGTVYCGTYDSRCRIHNDSTMLSSQLYFVPVVDGTYYVEVSTSSGRPAASGRYGTYSLQILR